MCTFNIFLNIFCMYSYWTLAFNERIAMQYTIPFNVLKIMTTIVVYMKLLITINMINM